MNYHDWLNKNLGLFLNELGLDSTLAESIIICDADKCTGYKYEWCEAGIPFEHGVAMYLITKFKPYCYEVRDTKYGWISPDKWVINNYNKFKPLLNNLK